MDRDLALRLLDRFHDVQGAFYAGGPGESLRELLTDDVVWHVPGRNAIAGTYRGAAAVMDLFTRRRALATRTLRMQPGEVLVGPDRHVAFMTDGTATVGDRERRWSTVGLYRFERTRIAECWLLPLDPDAFDAAWEDGGR